MRKLLCAVSLLALPLMVSADEYVIDSGHTYPNFSVSHLGFSVTHGRFNSTEGTLIYDPQAGTGSVEVIIDAASIDTGHDKRDEHLRNSDFLNVAEYPQITFKSSSASFEGETGTVEGDLSILDVTLPVTLVVDSIVCKEHPFNKKRVCGFNAATSFNRSEFGIKYGVPLIGDEMSITLQVEAIHKDDVE